LSRVASVYLSKAERDRFMQVCDKESCTPYSLVKKTVLDHIWAYPLENAPVMENEALKQDLGEEAVIEAPEPKPLEMDAEAVSETVRKILKGEV